MANSSHATKQASLFVECEPSLEESFVDWLKRAGFRHKTEAILTLVRDCLAGRINYKSGILQRQFVNSNDSKST
jgi:hypothetical protein